MPTPRIFGIEHEYGLAPRPGTADHRISASELVTASINRAWAPAGHGAPHLSSAGQGSHLPCGCRVYLDIGQHPEHATAEAASPAEAAAHANCGAQQIAATIAEQQLPVLLLGGNLDAHGNPYGCHESYQIDNDAPEPLTSELLASHVASRAIWAGNGTRAHRDLDPSAKPGQWALSQRLIISTGLIGKTTPSARFLIDVRDEPLADRRHGRRLHVTGPDSNAATSLIELRLATSDLLLRIIEQDPAAAALPRLTGRHARTLHTWAYDLAGQHAATTTAGPRTMRQLQYELLDACASHPAAQQAPWHADTIRRWADALANPHRSEWATKRDAMDRYADRHSLPPDATALIAADALWHTRRATNTPALHPPAATRAAARTAALVELLTAQIPTSVTWQYLTVEANKQKLRFDDPHDHNVERARQAAHKLILRHRPQAA